MTHSNCLCGDSTAYAEGCPINGCTCSCHSELTDSDIIIGLDAAIRIIYKKRQELACGSTFLWTLSKHAEEHLDRQIKELLRKEVA